MRSALPRCKASFQAFFAPAYDHASRDKRNSIEQNFYGNRHLRNVEIIVEQIVIEKLAGRACNDLELDILGFNGAVEQWGETGIARAEEF